MRRLPGDSGQAAPDVAIHNVAPAGQQGRGQQGRVPACPARAWRCSRFARVMSGSRRSRGSGSPRPRRPALAALRGLVIRICDILHPPEVRGGFDPCHKASIPSGPYVVTASTRTGARRAAIPGYRLARRPPALPGRGPGSAVNRAVITPSAQVTVWRLATVPDSC